MDTSRGGFRIGYQPAIGRHAPDVTNLNINWSQLLSNSWAGLRGAPKSAVVLIHNTAAGGEWSGLRITIAYNWWGCMPARCRARMEETLLEQQDRPNDDGQYRCALERYASPPGWRPTSR